MGKDERLMRTIKTKLACLSKMGDPAFPVRLVSMMKSAYDVKVRVGVPGKFKLE